MQQRWFWKSWTTEYKRIGYFVGLLFIIALVFLWSNYFTGVNSVIHWEKLYDQKPVETVAHTFQVGNFEFAVPIESYLTFEYFNGSNLSPNTTASTIFIIVIILCANILITVITTFKRFWYFIGTGLFILFLVTLRLEVLRVFGMNNQYPVIAVIILYVSLSFYFTIATQLRSSIRLASFLLLTLTIGVIVYFFSAVQYPLLHLSVTAYTAGLVLTILFVIMVAHEILASFVYLTSQGVTTSKSLNHFLIISVVYLGNLMLAYLHEAGIIDWDFLFINLYLLLTVSAVLGIWGFRHREHLYQHITSFDPFGAYFLVALGSIAFATTGMLLGTANDPTLKVIRDFIIFSHLGFGLIFMLYFFSNFIIMMADNLNVYKVLYLPNRMPYITYRMAGFITMLAFVFYSNWKEYVYHGTSGFYNSLGDLYTLLDKEVFAEAYYQQGRSYGFQNHRSNYVIAQRELHRNNFEKAHYHYQMASGKRPTEFSLVNDGNLYLSESKYFKGIFALRTAAQKFTSSGVAQNNLGYAYTKIHLLDSALLLFDQARNYSLTKESAEINSAAFLAQEYLPIKADSLARLLDSESFGVASNALVIATSQQQPFSTSINPLAQKELTLFEATFLNNYIVNKVKSLDTVFTQQAFEIASDSLNSGFNEAIKASLAHAFYHQGNTSKALQVLAELAYLSQSRQGKYNYIMGLWALEQGDAHLAAQSFDYAVEYSYKDAKVYHAIALTESRQSTKALVAIDTLLNSSVDEEVKIGLQLKKILTLPPSNVMELNDEEKYQYLRYRVGLNDSTTFNRIVATLKNENLKTRAILDMATRQFEFSRTESAIRYFEKLDGLRFTDKALYTEMQFLELDLLASRGQLRLLAQKINEGVTFDRPHELQKLLYAGILSEASGDTLTAGKNFSVLARYNPFYEEGVIAAARYFKKHSTDSFKAYSILTDALHVNRRSVRLLQAYIAEATRMGFDNYAADAEADLQKIVAEQQ